MEQVISSDLQKIENSTNVSNISGFSGFSETEEGRILAESCNYTAKRKKAVSRIVLAVAVGVAFLMYLFAKPQSLFNSIFYGIIFYLLGSIITFVFGKIDKSANKKYFNARWDYGIKVAEAISSSLKTNYYSFYNGEIFLYSNELCCLIFIESGQVIIYKRNNIKEVNLEHVHLGSTSTSTSKHSGSSYAWTNSYATHKGKTNTTTSTVDHYEWRLDVFSNVVEFPKITLTFSDGEENAAKQIYALLK